MTLRPLDRKLLAGAWAQWRQEAKEPRSPHRQQINTIKQCNAAQSNATKCNAVSVGHPTEPPLVSGMVPANACFWDHTHRTMSTQARNQNLQALVGGSSSDDEALEEEEAVEASSPLSATRPTSPRAAKQSLHLLSMSVSSGIMSP